MNAAEKNHLVKVDWKYEGIGWYSDVKKAVPLYRAYNPNAKAGSHNYTVNYAEQQNLLRVGWRNEGIAWYGIKKTTPITKYTVTVKHVGSDGKTLKSTTASIEKGKNYTAKSENFSGYTLKGSSSQTVAVNGNKTITFNYTKNAATPTKYTVTVKYVDEAGKEIAKATTASVEKGKSYTAKAATVGGYTLKGSSSQTITVSGNKTITFNYTKNTELDTKYTITIKYVDESGKEIAKAKSLSLIKGESYKAEAVNVTGYTVKGSYNQTVIADGNKTVTFKYTKNVTPATKYTITVKHVDGAGKEIAKTTTASVDKGMTYTAAAADITGYTVDGEYYQTVIVDGNQTIVYKYKLTKYTVQVIHEDSDGEIIELESYVFVEYGQKHTATAKTIDDYTLSGEKTQTVTVNGPTIIRFKYTKNAPVIYKISVKYIDESGKAIQPSTTTEIEKGKTFSMNAPSITGYTVMPEDKIKVIAYINENETVTFRYTKNPTPVTTYKVTVKHVGSDGKSLSTTTEEIEKGKSYTTKAATFTGYTLNGNSTQTISAVNSDQTLTFTYNLNKYDVTVVHKGSDGTTLETEKAVSVDYDKEHTARSKTFEGYSLSGTTTQTVTVKDVTTITFTYNLNKYDVTVVHKGSDGENLETEKAVSVDYGKTHLANAKTFAGYTLSGAKTQTVIVKGHTTITFNYTKNAAPIVKYNVTVVHKGNDGSVLETEAAVAVESGKTHTANAKSFTGYKIVGSNAQTVTVTGDVTITFDYTSLAFDTVKMNVYLDNVYQKTVTKLVTKGEKFIPSSDKLELDPEEYDLVYTIQWAEMTAVGGETRTYSFYMSPFKHYLSESELIIMQQTIIQKVNELRLKEGVSPLQENPQLKAAAAVRAKELKQLFSHTRPDGRSYQTALTEQGLTCQAGENIAGVGNPKELVSGKAAGEAMFKLWENSPGHRDNMVGSNYKFIGMDVYCYGSMVYGTQLFTDVIK